MLLALHQRGYPGLITLDDDMLELPKEMAVVRQTRLTDVAIEAVGHTPLQAMGELMVHACHIANAYLPDEPQIYLVPRRRFRPPQSAWSTLSEIADRDGSNVPQLFTDERLTAAELADPVCPP